MRMSQEKMIGGRRCMVAQLPVTRALKVLRRLGSTLGPALAKAAGASKGASISLAALNVESLADAVALLFERLTDAELDYLLRELLSTAQVMGEGDKWLPMIDPVSGAALYDGIYAGNIAGLLALLAFAVEVNFGDFFVAIRGSLQAQMTASRSAESSTSPSAGLSGAS